MQIKTYNHIKPVLRGKYAGTSVERAYMTAGLGSEEAAEYSVANVPTKRKDENTIQGPGLGSI